MARDYFEREPWHEAMFRVKEQGLGGIAEIAVNCVCPKAATEDTFAKWKNRVTEAAGDVLRESEIKNEYALSYIAELQSGAIIRIFIDEAASGLCENFEIVTEKALLTWKPASHPQSVRYYGDADAADNRQAYSVDLEVRA